MERQRALIVEDNRSLNLEIARTLKANNYQVVSVYGGLEGLVHFEKDQPDFMLLDLHLPGLNGFEVCRRIRQRSNVPIIMLSTLRDNSAKVAALDIGVDDYLLIPFEMSELLARMRALMRRSTWTRLLQPGALRIGALEIDLTSRHLVRNGQNIHLSRTDWALLEILIHNAGRVLTHRFLSQRIWQDDCGDDNVNLRVAIGRLRRKLEDDPANPQYLLTESGIGYFFTPLDNTDKDPLRLLAGSPVARRQPNIPNQRTSFIGREEEINQLGSLLAQPHVRLVTLIGAGGSGKTRLSLQIAATIQDSFAHGVALVRLASINEPSLVKIQIAQTLGIKENGGQALIEKLKGFLVDKHMLLILDNFEQVIVAAGLIAELLDAAPGLKILVTSQIRLNISGEHIFEVHPLPLPNPADLPPLDELRRVPALALFTERAQTIQPDFILTAENAAAVTQLCIHLDGLPLAIELAAARINVLPPQAMLTRLSNPFSLLVGGEQDRPERHQTIRNTLDWSYGFLDAAERALFAQLSVFTGGGTLEAIEAICVLPDEEPLSIIDNILSLLNKSMLQQRVELLLENYAATRFYMLELIHEYARQRLSEQPNLRAVSERHARYYLALAEQADGQLASAQGDIAQILLERDHNNLQAAIQWALDAGEKELALRLCAALWKFWHGHGYQGEGRRWMRAVLDSTYEVESQARVLTLYGSGWLHFDQGDWAQAAANFEASLQLARKIKNGFGIAEALHGVGLMARMRGDEEAALACYQESLSWFRKSGSREGIAWTLDHLGRVVYFQGDSGQAVQLISEALEIFRDLQYRRGIALMLGNLGGMVLQQGDLSQAEAYLAESLNLHEKLGDRLGVVTFQIRLAETARYQGRLDEAEGLLKIALGFCQELGYRWYAALALTQLAQVNIGKGLYTQAEAQLIEALRLYREAPNNSEGIVASLEGFAQLRAAQEQMRAALRLYSAAITIRQTHRMSLPPANRLLEERLLWQAQHSLAPDDYEAAWAEGQTLPLEALEQAFEAA
jgi:predicted ATPase/DNA-binding response OmpR family regulator/Tfp pilus assembly protein PilF